MKPIIITIDGEAASGKGTIAKFIKKEFNFFHIDSGMYYRKIAKIIIEKKIVLNKKKEISDFIEKYKKIDFTNNKSLRSLKISKKSSEIAKIKKIRNLINLNQKRLVKANLKKYPGFVIDGRDIGSVVFKNADIKLYINTNQKIRAKRRYKELIDRGERIIYSNVLNEIKIRDEKDKNRKYSPLIIPENAIIIDNSCNLQNTKKLIKNLIIKKLSNKSKNANKYRKKWIKYI